ncbi:rhomboid family intramembrane serine protease [Mucilaginibacter gynuensis]|uniref:Rhomboid family intramembrane serine protease n=1 Tax=Mucilaginibacter gynuensis TaxID=1302236 RepID=A0ABP8GAA7_9SPHI
MTLWQNITYKIQSTGSKLYYLIGINVFVFLLSSLVPRVSAYLAFSPDVAILSSHLWTPVSFMFMHVGILAIIFNMLWLYWIGTVFEDFLGYKRIVGLYIMGGLAGAALYSACYYLVPLITHTAFLSNAAIPGGIAALLAIIVGTATLAPNFEIKLILFGNVKLKWLVVVYIVADLINYNSANAGEKIAHLGGAILGFAYIKSLQNGTDWLGAISNLFKPRPKLKVVSRNFEKNTTSYPPQEEIDRILDKILQSGYDSLNKQEKEVLSRASKDEG